MKKIGLMGLLLVFAASHLYADDKVSGFFVSSSAFPRQGIIPSIYTCDGKNSSPPIAWSGLPASAKSLALIVDDPDAPDPTEPQRTWVHWVLYDIPVNAHGLSENAAVNGLPSGTMQGLNDWKHVGYGGPCPPVGQHRYFFKLYALDVVLPDLKQPDKARLENAMQGHVIAHVEMIGKYPRF
jgi:Raf kinase inhibitor-like YbhB/YbcL family protein